MLTITTPVTVTITLTLTGAAAPTMVRFGADAAARLVVPWSSKPSGLGRRCRDLGAATCAARGRGLAMRVRMSTSRALGLGLGLGLGPDMGSGGVGGTCDANRVLWWLCRGRSGR